MLDLFTWWVMVEVIGLVAFPIMMVLARKLPGRGYAFSKVLGILLLSYGTWLLANLHIAAFSQGLIVFVLLLISGFSAWLLLRAGGSGLADLRAFVRQKRSVIVGTEVVFLIFFLAWAFFRALDPDMNGQEKWMDFGFINSILSSDYMPPKDMWMSGYLTNYYYFGYMMAATLIKLSGINQNVGYNLSNILVFALAAVGCYGLVYEMVSLRLRGRQDEADPELSSFEGEDRAAIVTQQIVTSDGRQEKVFSSDDNQNFTIEASPLVEESRVGVRRSFARDSLPHLIGVFAALLIMMGGSLANVQPWLQPAYTVAAQQVGAWAEPPQPFWSDAVWNGRNGSWYGLPWNATRLIHDWQNGQKEPADYGNITETPNFSAVLNDFHPHYSALPLTILALALALALMVGGFGRRSLLARGLDSRLSLIVTAVVVGCLYFANTWDYPTYLLVVVLVLLANRLRLPAIAHDALPEGKSAAALGFAAIQVGARQVEGGPQVSPLDRLNAWLEPRRWLGWLVQAGTLVALSLLAVVPYLLTYKAPFGTANLPDNLKDNFLVNLPLVKSLLNIFTPNFYDKSFEGFLILFGVSLYAIVTYLVAQVVITARKGLTTSFFVAGGAMAASLLLAFAFKFPLLPLLVLLIAGSIYVLVRGAELPTADRFALLLIGVASFVALGCEMFFLNDVFNKRMNTLFKFYYQLWLIFGLLAAYAAWWVGGRVFGYAREWREERARPNPALGAATAVWAVGFSFLVLLAAIYPMVNIRTRLLDNGAISRDGKAVSRPLSLDSWAEFAGKIGIGGDLQAMDWLRANTPGDATILEANPDQEYQLANGGRVSSYTGRPAVLAWQGHERQWHKGDDITNKAIDQRLTDVKLFYTMTGAGPVQSVVDKYKVDYVFYGSAEKALDAGGKTQQALDSLYTRAYSGPGVVIYATPHSAPGPLYPSRDTSGRPAARP